MTNFASQALVPWSTLVAQAHPGWVGVNTQDKVLEACYQPLCQDPEQPWVLAQMGQSLDGRIALSNGVSRGLNGPAGEAHLHRLRALVDVVVIGSTTAEVDDPKLTVRAVAGPNPVRVIIDRQGRLNEGLQVFQDNRVPTLQLVGGVIKHSRQRSIPELLDTQPGVAERAVLAALRAEGLHRVLIEGGGKTVSRFMQSGLVDRLHITVSPIILGSGTPAFTLAPITDLAAAWQGRCRRFELAQDTLFDLDLSRP